MTFLLLAMSSPRQIRAHSIAVEQFHGMEQVRVRLPVGPHTPQKIRLRADFLLAF